MGAIGLECSLEQLHFVQLESGARDSIRVRARASVPYDGGPKDLLESPKSLRALVQQALKTDKFSGRKVVSALPSGELRIMSLSYHVNPGQGDAGAILKLMQDRLDGDMADYVIDYLPVRSADRSDQRTALVAIARREMVISYLEAMRRAGLEVTRLEISPVAIRRLVAAMAPAGQRENVLVINFGSTSSYLTIISGQRLLFDQQIQFGERKLVEQVGAALDMSEGQARELVSAHGLDPAASSDHAAAQVTGVDVARTLMEIVKPIFLQVVDEINRALIYMASETHGESLDRVYLLGSVARWRGADTLLNKLLVLPVETIPNPHKVFLRPGSPEAVSEDDAVPETAVATGLALHGLSDHHD